MNRGLIIILMCLIIWSPLTHAKDEEVAAKASYFVINEPFTINFLNQSDQQVTYLQIRVALMSHDADTIASAELNLPLIQDALRTLFTDQTYASVSTVEGRVKLQQDALTLLKSQLLDETGSDKLDAVYFTSFILQ